MQKTTRTCQNRKKDGISSRWTDSRLGFARWLSTRSVRHSRHLSFIARHSVHASRCTCSRASRWSSDRSDSSYMTAHVRHVQCTCRGIRTRIRTSAHPSTLRHTCMHTAPHCTVSHCEEMRQLINCIGLSARKKCSSDSVRPELTFFFTPHQQSPHTGELPSGLGTVTHPPIPILPQSQQTGTLVPTLRVTRNHRNAEIL